MPTDALAPRLSALKKRCPGADLDLQFPPEGRLPDGAVQVRICNFTGDVLRGLRGRPELDYHVPVDALTTGVDQVVDLVNAAADQESSEPHDTICGGVGTPTQVFWFTYPETDFAVRYNAGGCDELKIGESTLAKDKEVATRISDLLWKQRADSQPPKARVRANCSPNLIEETPVILSPDLELADAVLCSYPGPGGERQARLPSDALAAVNDDFHITDRYEQRSCDRGHRTQMLRGVTTWGDVFTMSGGCWDFPVQYIYGSSPHWHASRNVQTTLGELRFGPTREQDTGYPGQ